MGTGADGAIVLFDIDGDPDDDRYFMPTESGLSLIQFENDVAVVSGQVADVDDPTAILNVSIYYDGGTSGAAWGGGYKYDMSCTPSADITDAWSIYILNSGLSFLVGEGSMDGTTLQLSHAPSSEYFGFQVGEMANDRNCNYGAGGWFSYEGAINGVDIQGGTGDVLLDLECNEEENNACGEDESTVTLFYAAYDADCNEVLTGTETFTRNDTQDPTFDNAPANVSVACENMDIEVPVVTASDNCEDSDASGPTVTYNGQTDPYDQTCTGSYKVDRTWTAEDCSGNQVGHTQTITVYDNTAPDISTGASPYTAECDGAGNSEEFFAWLNSNGGAMASDNCGTVEWSNDFVITPEGEIVGAVQDCSFWTGSLLVTFTATDDCGNASQTSATFTIEDTTVPVLTATPMHEIACEDYASDGIYGASSADVCGDSQVVLVSVSEVSSSCAGSYLHTYKAVDECDNESLPFEQVVNLLDPIAPTFTLNCPANQDLFTDENCSADTGVEANGAATYSDLADNCDDAPEVEISHSDETTPGCTGSYTIARTWTITATDHCENPTTHTCVQTITVTDNVDPVPSISCPGAYTVDADEDCAADTTPAAAGIATASATDNCSPEANITLVITHEDSEAVYACVGEYSFVRTWMVVATDDCGNDASIGCTQTITVLDNTAPTWDGHETYVYAPCEDLLEPTDPTLVPISASDNCSDVTYSIEAYQLSGGCPGTWMRKWTATDDCGNISEETEQYVQLFDIIKPVPVITCPEAYTVDADGACEADTTPAAAGEATATATDNCAAEEDITIEITYEDGPIADVCDGAFYFTRTWTAEATDECDNVDSISCDQLITVEDNTNPVITGGDDETVECDGSGNLDDLNAWLDNNGGATATDNCSAITWTHDYEDGDMSDDCAATGSVDVIFTATDDCGNFSSTSVFTFEIEDTTAPVISGNMEESVACDAWTCDADALEAMGLFSVAEDCGDYTLDITCSAFSGFCVTPVPGYSITVTATDECGNASLAFMQIIDLYDDVDPVASITCPAPYTTTADASCNADTTPAAAGTATATATDNCDASPEVTISHEDGESSYTCSGSYSFTRTWTATAEDHCGNEHSVSCDQLITVNDETAPSAPVISCPANAEVFLGADCTTDSSPAATGAATATATDNCDASPSIEISHSDGELTYTCTGDDDQLDGSYSFVRTWTAVATDDCNNVGESSSCTQTITVTDNTAPDFAGSSAVFSIPCDEYSDDDQYEVMAADNCDDASAITILSNSQVSGSCAGSILRTYQAIDDCGNSITFEQVINLTDVVEPVVTITCPDNADLTADADCSADTSPEANGTALWTATDNCDTDLDTDLFFSDAAEYGCEGSYTITRTWTITATDHCDNVSSTSCDQIITVTDVTAPAISGGANALVECDGSGNTADLNAWLDSNGGATATDNCSAVSWSHSDATLSDACGATGTVDVIFTATDECDNSDSITLTFTIQDTTNPSASADAETEVACDEYDPTVAYGNFTAGDACSDVTVVIADLAASGACAGSYSRTYTVTDDCGNETLVYQIINLTDEDAPSFDITCPANVDLVADADCNADTSVETHGSATYSNVTDNCDDDVEMEVTSSDETEYGCQGSYTISRTWTITGTDHCDNPTVKTCVQTITVSDETAPAISGGANALVECDGSGNMSDLNAWLANNGGATATDNCSAVSWSHSDATLSDACGATGTVDVIFTATDECENSDSITLTFTIQDTTQPSLSIEGPANQNLDQNATCNVDTSVEALGNVSASADDACGSASIEITHVDGVATYTCAGDDATLEGSYTFVRTFTVTATDECGLQTTDTYEQTITVTDGSAPQFTETCGLANGDVVDVCCEDLSGTVTIPDACDTEASDNCDSDVAIASDETYVGEYAPTDAVMSFCLSTTPAAYADGEACNGLDPHAFSLFNFDGEPRVDFTSVGSGLVSQMNDGTWMLQQELVNEAGTGMLTLTVTYGAASSWDDWFTPGQTNYKRDCGVLVDDHENWDYRILESGSVMGSGDYAGLDLSLSHAPANEYYAFQIGLGANNQNDNYGYSGWIMATGTYGDDAVFFSGDLFGDLDCCLPWSIDREYTASDDCGNATDFAYSISVNGDDCGDDDGALVSGGQGEDHTPGIIGGAGDVLTGKSPIRVTNLQPNPTNDLSLLGFTVTQNMRLRVDMYTMEGILVSELYDGVASPNVNHTLDIEADALQSGMYQIRLSSSQYLVVKKLLVTE